MKKIAKNKRHRKEGSKRATATVAPDPPPTKTGKESKTKQQVQALLLMPPPPDMSSSKKLAQKKNKEGQKPIGPCKKSPGAATSSDATAEFKPITEPRVQETKSKTLCRDFMKGKCTRGTNCKFSHKYDVSQLVGVHNFCKNFQESICTRTDCKYIHATVLEEQRFHQTGELPQHSLVHHKKGKNRPISPPSPQTDVDRSLQELDEEEELLRKRIEIIKGKLEKIRRAKNKKRLEREMLEKKRDKVGECTPPGEQQKLFLDQLNEAIKTKMAESRPDSTGEIFTNPKEKQKIYLDQLNHAIKLNLVPSLQQKTVGLNSEIDMPKFLATLMCPKNAETASGSQASAQACCEPATSDEAAGPVVPSVESGTSSLDVPDSTDIQDDW